MDIAGYPRAWYNSQNTHFLMAFPKQIFPVHRETLGILAVSVALAAAGPVTVFWMAQIQDGAGEQTQSASAEETDVARARAGTKPQRLTKDERDRKEAESKLREEVGRRIESLRESQGDAIGTDVSFDELRAQALQQLNIAASALDSPSPSASADGGHDQAAGEGEQINGLTAEQRLVCFRADGSVTDQRDECAENQSGFFGLAAEEQENSAWHGEEQWQREDHRGFTMPSDDAMAEQMSRRFEPHAAAPGPGGHGMTGDFGPPNMTAILAMMDKMIAKLPKVIAIFEGAGIPIDPQAREAARAAEALYKEVRDDCGNGTMSACMRMEEIGTMLETRMRPPMEKAIMKSGQWQVGMQIGALMSEGMDGMMMGPPGGSSHGMPGGGYPGDYPPSGYGPPSGYEDMGRRY